VVDVDAIELPPMKSKKQRAEEITQDIIIRTSFVADCIKATYLSSDSEESKESEFESESESVKTVVKLHQGHAIKTHLAKDPGNNSWNVTVKDTRGNEKYFEVSERELLGGEFIIGCTYNAMSMEQKKEVLAKNKQMWQKEA
jgi:hypothetical protein